MTSDLSTMFFDSLDEAASLGMPPCLDGDPYREDDNVTRGVTLDSDVFDSAPPIGFFGKANMDANAEDFLWDQDWLQANISLASQVGYPSVEAAAQRTETNPRFQEGNQPDDIPKDSFFKLEATTMFVPLVAMPSHKLGNIIVEILIADVASEITKVNTSKFSLKANSSANGRTCDVKIKIYRQSTDYAIEFQRCCGDSFAFASWYQWVSKCLISRVEDFPEKRFSLSSDEAFELSQSTLLIAESEWTALQTFQPVIDLAHSDEPCFQLESAIAFAVAAESPDNASQLCACPNAMSCLAVLLQSSHCEVATAATRALQLLALCPHAEKRFAEQDLFALMNVASRSSHQRVRELALAALRNVLAHEPAIDHNCAKDLASLQTSFHLIPPHERFVSPDNYYLH